MFSGQPSDLWFERRRCAAVARFAVRPSWRAARVMSRQAIRSAAVDGYRHE